MCINLKPTNLLVHFKLIFLGNDSFFKPSKPYRFSQEFNLQTNWNGCSICLYLWRKKRLFFKFHHIFVAGVLLGVPSNECFLKKSIALEKKSKNQ